TAVDNEINVESAAKNFHNLYYANVDYLPDNHPHKRWDLGNSVVLHRMSVDDLKHLFYANYQPQYIKVVIAGNFSNSELTKENVLKWLKKSLIAPSPERDPDGFELTEKPMAEKYFQRMYTHVQETPFIAYQSKDSTRMSMHLFESIAPKQKINLLAEYVLRVYINSTAPGSLKRKLINKGWITSLNLGRNHTPTHAGQDLLIKYTQEGWQHRDEILVEFYKTLAAIKTKGVDDYVFEVLKGLMVESFRQEFKYASEAMENMQDLFEFNNPELLKLDFSAAFSKISVKDLQTVVSQMYNPRLTANVYMSPDVQGEYISATFDKAYKQFRNPELLDRLAKILKNPKASSLHQPQYPVLANFVQRGEPLTRANSDWQIINQFESPILTYLREDHQSIKGAFHMDVPLTGLTKFKNQVAMDIYYAAFSQSIGKYLTVLRSRGIYIGLGTYGNRLQWSGEGNAQELAQAFAFISQKFSEYQPTEHELQNVIQTAKANLVQKISSSFVASLAATYAVNAFKHQVNFAETLDILENLNISEITKIKNKTRMQGRPHLFMMGDFQPEDSLTFISSSWNAMRFSFPHTTKEAYTPSKYLKSHDKVKLPLPIGKSESSYGLSRIYQGPHRKNLHESAIALLLNNHLEQSVFNLNRSERGLGYVHGAGAYNMGIFKQFIFYGQADDTSKADLTKQGWEEVIAKLLQREIDESVWENYRSAVISELSTELITPLEKVQRAALSFRETQDIEYTQSIIEELKTVTPADIYRFVDKYFHPDRPHYNLEISNCREALE
ncbi:MAG: insulinase family protein, partial [Bdellovibrionales bacterium]|nr:insulinase family protein [Bdellovibrionales bacterium]